MEVMGQLMCYCQRLRHLNSFPKYIYANKKLSNLFSYDSTADSDGITSSVMSVVSQYFGTGMLYNKPFKNACLEIKKISTNLRIQLPLSIVLCPFWS